VDPPTPQTGGCIRYQGVTDIYSSRKERNQESGRNIDRETKKRRREGPTVGLFERGIITGSEMGNRADVFIKDKGRERFRASLV